MSPSFVIQVFFVCSKNTHKEKRFAIDTVHTETSKKLYENKQKIERLQKSTTRSTPSIVSPYLRLTRATNEIDFFKGISFRDIFTPKYSQSNRQHFRRLNATKKQLSVSPNCTFYKIEEVPFAHINLFGYNFAIAK